MILDTNALSAWAEGIQAVEEILGNANSVSVPSIVLGEYYFGIQQSRYYDRYARWLNLILPNIEIASVDRRTAQWYAQIRLELKRNGTPIPSNDTWIAAIGKQYDSPILSNDTHLDRVIGVHRIGF
ncbi:MAG: PIN domain-containing protein [Acidiferrobacterales bacterium]|nr:PIN domain-containing protein [Acidiferrobacterales bacterium]